MATMFVYKWIALADGYCAWARLLLAGCIGSGGGVGNCGVIYTAVTGMEFGVHGEAKLRDEECVGAG